MNNLFLFFHIPRTGGTFFTKAISNYLDRSNDNYLKHFNYLQGVSETTYPQHNIPLLRHRTTEQQKQLRILTGHSIISVSPQWLRVHKNPLYFTIVRDPVKRLLSSFNMRHNAHIMMQNPQDFSTYSPTLCPKAIYQEKTAQDYDNLYEYYLDAVFEHNIQVKWLIKSFYVCDQNQWQKYPDYMLGPDTNISTNEHYPLTWPNWMYSYDPTINYWDLLEPILEDFWYIETTDNLTANLPNIAKAMELDFDLTTNQTDRVHQYWSYNDVINQPYFDVLCNELSDDFKLYNYALTLSKPWRENESKIS